MGDKPHRENACCSFCGKDQSQVRKLVAGPGVYICDRCIALCNEVLQEDSAVSGHWQSPPLQRRVRHQDDLLGRLRERLGLKSKGWRAHTKR